MASFEPDSTLIVMALREESCGLFEDHGIYPLYTGVGQVRAAHALSRAIFAKKPKHILNLGTAGSFVHTKGTCFECSDFIQRQINRLSPQSKKISVSHLLSELPSATCGTADFIQTTLFAEVDSYFTVMDMEAYALAYVSQQHQIPFHAIKYISDHSNDLVISDWKKNLQHSAESLFQIFMNLKKNYSS